MSSVAIQLENELTFDAPRERVWALFSDVPRVVPCIPGGRLVETIDDATWRAEVSLDLGFTRVVFLADVTRQDQDEAAGRAVLAITAVDSKDRSHADATMTSLIAAGPDGTRVKVVSDVKMEGEVARFGAGIIEDVSYEIVDQMAECLRKQLAAPDEHADTGGADAVAPATNRLSLWAAIRLFVRGRLRRGRRRRASARARRGT